MLVMHFMRLADCAQVKIIGVAEDFYTTMNEHIVHQEVSKTMTRYAESKLEIRRGCGVDGSKENEHDAWYCEDDEEPIILLQMTIRSYLMMVAVQPPQQTMHNVFVRQPGYTLHQDKC